jgi:hypothetical protein
MSRYNPVKGLGSWLTPDLYQGGAPGYKAVGRAYIYDSKNNHQYNQLSSCPHAPPVNIDRILLTSGYVQAPAFVSYEPSSTPPLTISAFRRSLIFYMFLTTNVFRNPMNTHPSYEENSRLAPLLALASPCQFVLAIVSALSLMH